MSSESIVDRLINPLVVERQRIDFINRLRLKGDALALMRHCHVERFTEHGIVLSCDAEHAGLLTDAATQRVSDALASYFDKQGYRVRFVAGGEGEHADVS